MILLWLLPVIGGCTLTPTQKTCTHQWGPLQAAVSAGFFETGTIAHHQCTACGALADTDMSLVDTVTVPKLSTELYLRVSGKSTALTVTAQGAASITWTLPNLAVSKGDRITLEDAAGNAYAYTASGESNLDETGRIINTTVRSSVTLTATRQGLTLSIRNDEHPGIVVQINGEQYPMHTVTSHDTAGSTYMYGYAQLRPGDSVVIIDNINDTTYGYDDLSESLQWNDADFHRGAQGELVIDYDARYILEFSKDGNDQVYITKTFGPTYDTGYHIHLKNSDPQHVAMEDVLLTPDSLLFREFAWYAQEENTVNGTDIGDHIAGNGLHISCAALFLEAGTQFCIEDTSTSAAISGDHLTQFSGAAGCFRVNGQFIEITQSGTYYIGYLPSHGSISLEQLSTGSLDQTVREFDEQIAAVPSKLELYYRDEILSLYRQYLKLPSAVRSRLKASAKLEVLYQNASALDRTAPGVLYYMNTESTHHVYRSREALMEAFFTDFYYYIAACHGTSRLRDNGIKTAADFVALAKVFPDAAETDFYQIGYIAGRYLLESKSNGILDSQSKNGFLGFCYQKGLYQEILPFLIRYFAYWRIDEGYATTSNCGADLFAEGWAPTVDITKFFYYDETSSPVRTSRMIDCFTDTAGVVYSLDPEDPLSDIRLRGYIFEGWYDNPEYNGNPVTSIEPADGPVLLYAKWRTDTQRQDQDAAALVDIYIYNLTTRQASVNSVTVGYVKAMYDALSESGKQLVENYPVLQKLIDQYIK